MDAVQSIFMSWRSYFQSEHTPMCFGSSSAWMIVSCSGFLHSWRLLLAFSWHSVELSKTESVRGSGCDTRSINCLCTKNLKKYPSLCNQKTSPRRSWIHEAFSLGKIESWCCLLAASASGRDLKQLSQSARIKPKIHWFILVNLCGREFP